MNSSRKLVCIWLICSCLCSIMFKNDWKSHPCHSEKTKSPCCFRTLRFHSCGPNLSTHKMNKHIPSPRTWLMHILNTFILPDLLLSLLEGRFLPVRADDQIGIPHDQDRWPSASQYSNWNAWCISVSTWAGIFDYNEPPDPCAQYNNQDWEIK